MTSTFIGRPRFELGRVFERTFGAIGANLPTLLLSALLFVGLPQALWSLVSTQFMAGGDWTLAAFGALGGFVVSMACSVMLQGVVTHMVVTDLQGRRVSMGESIQAALKAFWLLLAVGILSGLGIALGMVLLIVPGVFLMLMWFVAGPVAVTEKRMDIGGAFERSARLTEDHRWMLLLLVVIYVVVVWVAMVLVSLVTLAFMGAGGSAIVVSAVGTAIVQSITSMLSAAGVAAVYVELRTVKEGAGREGVASIFE